ncbi:MAG: tRNA-dihydrouridine synthase, partial [Erysipelotrichaceae bacterium]|nr:tRNA-dihydrouridine synthase [Erysipelotrichaceae bacterium]
PVIGNGDIKSIDDMLEMKRQTDCDAFMVSRGCLGNPWLIQQLVHYEKYQERLEDPTFSEKLQQCLEHANSLCKLKGERIAIKEMRGHACWYINGMPNNNKVKAIINNITTYQQLEDLLRRYDEAMLSGDFRYFTGG